MATLIKRVRLSKRRFSAGDSTHVQVELNENAADVAINGIYGSSQYLQFADPGAYTIAVTAALGKQIEQEGERIRVVSRNPDVVKAPILWATQDRYQPRTTIFSVPNAGEISSRVAEYRWQFGDGSSAESQDSFVSHDYTNALERDRLYNTFDVRVDARLTNGFISSAVRTISVFNTYGFNKVRRQVLTPRVAVESPIILPMPSFLPGEVICAFTVTNLEDEEITFTEEKHEWLNADLSENPWRTIAAEFNTPVIESAAAIAIGSPATIVSTDLRVPPRSTVAVARPFPQSAFAGTIFGVAIHFAGFGTCSKLPAISSAYIEVKLPIQWSGYVVDPNLFRLLSILGRSKAANLVTHQDLSDLLLRSNSTAPLSASPQSLPAPSAGATSPSASERLRNNLGAATALKPSRFIDSADPQFTASLANLLAPNAIPFDDPAPVVGQECDPDNLPDNLPDGMVCQLTNETAWRYVPGRVLNAKKGDLILDPGGPGLVGQLLRQVTPPQFYSHCGIMTKNHIELRHSTGSDDWLKDHPAGSFLGNKGTDGFDPAALKYLWPGTITQSIDNAYYGEWITSPDKGPYRIADFSFAPDLSNSSTIIPPIVVKPGPFDETSAVRLILHSIADAALAINGHYRFYCYTKPEIALGPAGIAGADAGWAEGTVATVCSSFIWLAAQHANVKLEGPNTTTSAGELEPTDVLSGAAVGSATLDGLYLYSESERLAAGKWLYQDVYNIAYNAAGFFGTLFTDAPDNVANQLCNTFASDWADGGSKDSDAWKSPGDANAVSPDNMILWDSPAAGNEDQFRSVYGHIEDLFYRPGTYAQVPIYRWKLVPTKGALTGRVVANADVDGADVSLLGSGMPDVYVHGDGRFEFDQVPAGPYRVTAGLNIGGYWYSTYADVTIVAGQTTDVQLALQPPPQIYRLVTISVEMETDWGSIFAHSPHYYSGTKSVKVHPFHSHEHLDFQGPDTPTGHLGFDIDLNADLSVTVSWTAQEIDDEVEGTVTGGYNVAQDGSLSWSGLVVVNGDPIDNDATTMSFTIKNEQASN